MYRSNLYIPVLIFLFLSLFCGCHKREETSVSVFPEHLLREGDLVFRRGTGIASRLVLAADRKGMYSHIGIVICRDSVWEVIHAVPGEPDFRGDPDRVKMEPVQRFFARDRAACGALMRVQGDPARNRLAARQALACYEAGMLFDHQYDLSDSTRVYCTELVQRCYLKEGTDLAEERITPLNVPALNGSYILPSDISNHPQIELIYQF
ncbi:MAG: hypothetical protein LUF04_04490 [Bacteroides sp.]|nr:hypothetical protein [Bacteroides sp.]